MKNQFITEIHTHTNHSDAHFTVNDLLKESKKFGYEGIVLTDHNSSSGYSEISNKNLDKKNNLIVLKGIEWTTYYGHMLVLDADYDIDWRDAKPDNIDYYLKKVKSANGLVGIAHPFDIGSPFCTGCHWEFNVDDYKMVDFIEIWNSNHPHKKNESEASYQFWLDKLRSGNKISCSTGRDWHRPDSTEDNMGITYVELEDSELSEKNLKDALANGHFYISLGPAVQFSLEYQGDKFYMGDIINLNFVSNMKIKLDILPTSIEALSHFEISDLVINLWNNENLIKKKALTGILTSIQIVKFTIPSKMEKGFLRFEITGTFNDHYNSRIVIGNPIYLE